MVTDYAINIFSKNQMGLLRGPRVDAQLVNPLRSNLIHNLREKHGMKNNIKVVSISLALLAPVAMAKIAPVKRKPPVTKPVAKPAPQAEHLENVITYPGASKVGVSAKQAILLDYNTGKILLEKNADERMAPSSMTKMMTTYIVEEKLQKGELKSDTEFKVSERAWRTQGSKMFVQLGSNIKVADLHKGIAIQSGNDASIVVAEGIMGTEDGFAIEMNRVAKELGMANTSFKNASGLPDTEHYSTARDLGKLAMATIRNHQGYYGVNKEKDFTYNGIKQGNRNPLLYDDIGCDGIKTGHTEAGGFGVAASCLDGDQRYIAVINGLPSVQARADEARKLVGWAKGNFVGKTLIKKGAVVEKAAKIKDGKKETLPLIASRDLYLLTLRTEAGQIKTTTHVSDNLVAPIKAGDRAGSVVASIGDNRVEVELLANEAIEKENWFINWAKKMLKRIGFI